MNLRLYGAGSIGAEHQNEKLKWNTAKSNIISWRSKVLYLQGHCIRTSTASC